MLRGIVLVALLLPPVPAAAQEVVVSAASSLADVLEQAADRYEALTGDRVALNLAASNTLARQIAAGAPVDVFVSADEAQMDRVEDRLVPGTRIDLLSNALAVVVPAGTPSKLASIEELADARFGRIAIGDPLAVPVGVYARAYLEAIGLWARVAGRIVPAGSARLALAAVETGAVDAAIVYRTDAAVTTRAATAWVVPVDEGPRIVYVAARVRDGDAPAAAAARFLGFLRGGEAAAVFEAAGFVPMEAPR